MGDIMNQDIARSYYHVCCDCPYCSHITFRLKAPHLSIGCAKVGEIVDETDGCPLNKWE